MNIKNSIIVVLKSAVIASLAVTVFISPTLSGKLLNSFIRESVSNQVFKIYGMIDREHHRAVVGTGSVMNIPNTNRTVIITNRHICEVSPNGSVTIEQGGFQQVQKIIKMSSKADLCAIETVPGYTGLTLADSYTTADEIMAVGHPSGYPTTKTTGEIIGYEDVTIGVDVKNSEDESKCRSYENGRVMDILMQKLEENSKRSYMLVGENVAPTVSIMPNLRKICIIEEKNSILATAQIKPGSSGSPLVSWIGKVVGVVFATSPDDYWTRAISLEKLKAFMKEL